MTDLLTADGERLWDVFYRTPGSSQKAFPVLRDEIVRQTRAAWERELAEVRRQAAWDALGEYCESVHGSDDGPCCEDECRIRRFRDRHYAPTPRSVTLSDGSVVTVEPIAFRLRRFGGTVPNPIEQNPPNWKFLLTRDTDTGSDFDALKAFAASLEAK